MWALWRRALTDPAGFFTDAEPSRRATAVIFGLTGLSALAPVPLVFVLIEQQPEEGPAGTLPSLVYAAGDATISVPGVFALILATTAAVPLIALASYGTVFHGLSWPVSRAGSVRQTAELFVWGLLPQTLGNLFVVGVLYLAYPLVGFEGGIAITIPSRVVAIGDRPRSLWVLGEAIGALTVVWSAWLWHHGLRETRGTSERVTAAIVGLVLGLSLALTPPVSRFLEPALA